MKQLPLRLIIIMLALVLAPLFSSAETFRVKINGSDIGDGSDWGANAMSNNKFAQALLTAQPGDIFQISTGTYIPYYDALGNVPGNARLKTFLVRTGVELRGGYSPNGTSSMDNSIAVLSGDIGTAGLITDNVYNVVTIAKDANNVLVSTVTVLGGYGNGGGNYSRGAGIFVGENAGTTALISLSHVKLTNNSSNGHGSGIFIDNKAVVDISESTISNNTRISGADTWGGGISVWNNAKVNVNSSEIFNNTALYGGGVHVTQATYTSNSSTYSNNSAGTHGGGIDAYLSSSISLSADKVLANSSGYGGGIHNEAGTTMQIRDAVIKGNTASYEGGGFLNLGDCTATFTNCVFDSNKAATKGGGIDNKGQMTINSSRIINNSATGTAWGGGINQSSGKLIVQQSEISGNTAKHGGGVHLEAGSSTISNTTISGNTALIEGGGFDSYTGTHNLIYTTITNNTAPANRGSGILVVVRPGLQNSIVSGNANNDNVQGVLNSSGTNSADNNIIGSHFYRAGNSAGQGLDVSFSASAHFDNLAFNRSANTQTHKLKWVANSLENPAVGRAVKLDGSIDPTYLKDQTNKNRGNKPSLGAYEEDLFKATDDVEYTKINTAITIEVSGNDAIPESCVPVYTLETGMSPIPLYGQFSALSGTLVTYTPNAGASGTDTLYYKLKCGALSNIARVIVTVGGKDHPGNIKDDEICMEDMLPLAFSAKEKYRNTASRLDGFSMPIVGDLDGDGKPEIIALGLRDNNDGFDLQAFARYVIVYNGQTGAEILKFDLRGSEIGSTEAGFKLRYETRHNGPSKFALADLDGQKGAELIVTETVSGRVYALKPAYTNGVLTNFTKMWEVATNHKSPIVTGALINFSTPMPYISDLNGDGIPEVIVYNKIYNGKTGNLILELETLNRFVRPITQANVNTYTNNQSPNGGGRAYVGRRPGTLYADDAIPAMAIIDIDNDGVMEIVAGSKVYKPNILPGSNSVSGNSFTIIHGPGSVSYPRANGAAGNNTYYLSDGFTAVADIDADGHLDIIVQTTTSDAYAAGYAPLIYVWDPRKPGEVKAVVAFRGQSSLGTMSMPFIGDINGRKDDYSGAKTLPEICFNAGILHTKEAYGSPISYHPLSSDSLTANARFNGSNGATIGAGINQIFGHVVGFTFHANPDGSTPVHERLKMSWAMEHGDESSCTGITMFDFDADGVKELVYRDETSLRVISPARQTYIPKNEPENALGSIRFKKIGISSYTGFEAPVIADVNGDGSADIVTFANLTSKTASYGNLFVFEADGESWASTRPVWNQAMYYPLQINDDLTVPSKPISTLTKFVSQPPGQLVADTIQPYNGNWIQQPIVRSGNYVPVIFTPDLSIEVMQIVKIKLNPDSTIIKLTVENRGKSSANSNTPITFYRTSVALGNKIITIPLGLDIFPDETVDLTYTIPGSATGVAIHARMVDDGTKFLATGFLDCDSTNNASYTATLKAVDDHYSIINNSLYKFDVRQNDTALCKLLPEIIELPKHGIAEITADSLLSYIATADYTGMDSLRYVIKCEYGGIAITDTACVYFIVAKKPDNISDAECYVTAPSTEWSIKMAEEIGNDDVSTYLPSLVGDLNGDGHPDIVIGTNMNTVTLPPGWWSKHISQQITIFKGPNHKTSPTVFATQEPYYPVMPGVMAIARVKYAGVDTGMIVVAESDLKLRAYDAGGNHLWTSDENWIDGTNRLSLTTVAFADFNNDGKAEVFSGNRIFDAGTGHLLCKGTGNSGLSTFTGDNDAQNVPIVFTVAANVYGDSRLELIAGNQVYEVAQNLSSMRVVRGVTPLASSEDPSLSIPNDGLTQIVDIDGDGGLDIVVQKWIKKSYILLYVWNPETQKVLAQKLIKNSNHIGIPFIGDIDGKKDADNVKHPEILMIGSDIAGEVGHMNLSYNKIFAFKYDKAQALLQNFWELPHSDFSGVTGLVLFDFNQDGISEIVYRDETHLRIINGSKKSHNTGNDTTAVYNLAEFVNTSGTGFEYPVVADVDSDGSAEILIAGGTNGSDVKGKLKIYKSDGVPWAPARKVWNQYAYNAVNVNEDLSIPKIQLSPTSVFPGEDGVLGTSDDVRPFNGFLQQQTILSKNGTPLWLLPNAEIGTPDPDYNYHAVGDSMEINLVINNIGDAALQNPVYITVYKDSVKANTAIKYTYAYNESITVGASVNIKFSIPDFKTWIGSMNDQTVLFLKINDDGRAADVQPVCKNENTTHSKPFSDILIASNDYITTLFSINVKVLDNDMYPASCSLTIAPVITTAPTNGTASVEAGGVIKYTPTVGFVGIDSIIYKISCDGKESLALLHITVPKVPDNINATSLCYTTVPGAEWSIKEAKKFGATVSTYLPAMVGDLNNDGYPDIVTGTRMNTAAKPPGWWTMHIGKHITVFKGPDHELATTNKEFETVSHYYPVMPGVMAIARVKYSGVDTGMIVVAEGDLKLRAYDVDGNNLWTSDENWIDGPLPTNALPSIPETSIGFADFNNDGKAEIYSGNRIFSAETGRLLCKGDQNRGLSRHTKVKDENAADVTFSVVANIYGDSRLELIAGNQVYEVAQDLSSMRVVREVSPPTSSEDPTLVIPNDGITQIIDIDDDGSLDVVVERWISEGNHFIYVWNPEREEVLAQKLLTNSNHIGIPFIGDIDGRKDLVDGKIHPEILLIGSNYGAGGQGTSPAQYNRIFAFKYDGTQLLSDFWKLNHSDISGLTGLVLFDFNQDGISEIVYRDQSHLRIINGSKISHVTGNDTTAVYNLADFVNTSGTGFEYPVVADVDADGSAEIIIAGGTSATVAIGAMRIYKSKGEVWAPARKVWNQYAYNVVNVNEDLTIPRYQPSPATVFPGVDGILGTSDDVRPFNAFLQQQTILNKDGIPLFVTPDAVIATPAPTMMYHSVGDSIVITLTVKNEGEAAFQNPFYLSAYADSIAEANLMAVDSIKSSIAVGDSITTIITIRNIKAYIPFNDLIINLNDKGKGVYNQAECEYGNNSYIRPFSSLLLANRDVVHLLKNSAINVNVLANDSLASCKAGILTGFDTIPNSGLSNGTLTVNTTDSTFTYTAASNFVGIDSVMYYIKCGADSSATKVYFNVHNKPDNIIDSVDCVVPLQPFDFKIKQKWRSDNNLAHRMSSTLVGDLDGDGIAEIAVYGNVDNGSNFINIFSGDSKTLKAQIPITSIHGNNGWRPAMVAAMVDADRNGLGEIIVARSDLKIMSYEADITGGTFKMTLKWTASQNFVSPTNHNLPHPNIADLNGDGVAELIVNNYVYNAATGAFLGQTEPVATANIGRIPFQHDNKATNFQTIADIDGDGILEIIAGGKVYKPHFNAAKTAVSFTKLFENTAIGDGYTSVADVDLDGNLDVVVGKATGASTTHLYIWSPMTGAMIDDFQIAAAGGYNGVSVPFIGDIDGYIDPVTNKKYPEICVNSVHKVFAYKYNPATGKYATKWILGTSDQSGATGIVLFDFNNDGINELVYRDQTHLRILNGVADNTAPVLADLGAIFACASSTALEYPSIADIDGDGSANICVTCDPYLTVYESGSTPWAPTRKVWNQVNYEPLLINDNLTTPRFPIPKNMEFEGKYPYNGAMIQVPIVDTSFVPVLIAADPRVVAMSLEAINATTLRVHLGITNEGTTNTNISLPVTLYHTDTIAANKIATKPIGVQIAPGDTVNIHWDVIVGTYHKFFARIQDDGTKYPADGSYLDCDYTNNLDSINVLLAVNDTLSFTSTSGGITFDVLGNDFLGACGRDNLTVFDTIPNSGLRNGTLVINADNTFTYTFNVGSSGVDSLSYYIKCGADSSAAKVYLLVNKPLSLSYAACPGAFVDMGFTRITGVQYVWYANPVGPPPIAINHTYPVTKDSPNDIHTWWVEPIWKKIKFPRYRIDLLPADNCGSFDPDGCAIDGTVIWKEDFDSYNDGLNPFSPKYSQVPLIAGMTTYTFRSYQGTFPAGGAIATGMYLPGNYAIVKDALDPNRTDSWLRLFRDDHTYPKDKEKGRFFVANGRNVKDQLYKQEIDGLCDSISSLYFSFWARGYHAELKWTIYSSDTDEVLSILSLPPMLDSSQVNKELTWAHYGFKFEIPAGVSSIYFDIYNNCARASGNDFALDDIEVRLCAPPVIISNPVNADTTVCSGTEFIFEGNYEEGIPAVFGNDLVYRWEYSETGDVNDPTVWNAILGTQGISNNGKVSNAQSKYTIASVSNSDEGYYRLVVGNASTIDYYNCRAMSKVIKLGIQDFKATPDIRIQVCPNMGNINFSSYLDTVGFHSVIWSGSALMPAVSALGIVNSNDFKNSATYKYFFKVESMGKCLTSEGVLYASTIKSIDVKLPPDTIVVCYKYADALQLNQILGIEAGSVIEAEEAIINADYVKRAVSPAIYYGATVFNGEAVYNNSALSGAVYNYTGPLTTGLAKKVIFKYTPAPGSCLSGKVYRFVIILTDELIP